MSGYVDIVSQTIQTELRKAADMSLIEKKLDNKARHMAEAVEMLNCKISEQKRKKTEEYILLTKNQITEEEFERRRDEINSAIAEYEQQIEKLRSEEMSSEKLTAVGTSQKPRKNIIVLLFVLAFAACANPLYGVPRLLRNQRLMRVLNLKPFLLRLALYPDAAT